MPLNLWGGGGGNEPAFVSGRGAETNTSAQPIGHVYFGKVRFRTPRTPPPAKRIRGVGQQSSQARHPSSSLPEPRPVGNVTLVLTTDSNTDCIAPRGTDGLVQGRVTA